MTEVDAGTTSVLHDWRGLEIKLGSLVVYPGRGSSSLWMTEGVVTDIGSKIDWRGRAYPVIKVRRVRETRYGPTRPLDGKIVSIESVDRVTVVQ